MIKEITDMRVHFISDKGKNIDIAFFPDTYRFFSINEIGKKLIDAICKKKEFNEIKDSIEIERDLFEEYREMIKTYAVAEVSEKLDFENNKKILNRVAINITNSCNLECKYCYANGGNYHTDEHIMPLEILEKTLNSFYDKFDDIRNIQLFGGEPLMSIRNIKFTCEYIRKLKKNRQITTSIGLVTNGTLINKKFIDLVNEYNIQITVSFDGTRLVNDINRVYSNGRGSSGVIIDRVNKLREGTNNMQPSQIEITYNRSHLQNGVTVKDCIDSCNKIFYGVPLHLVPAGGSDNDEFVIDDIKCMVESVDDIFDDWSENLHSYSLVDRIIRALVTKKGNRTYLCDAGIGTLSVSTKGVIYPCFMFTDNEKLSLGTVYDDNILSTTKTLDRLVNLEKFNNKKTNSKCASCFINNICSGCLGLNELNSGKVDILSDKDCEMHKKMVEKVILRMAERVEKSNV